MAIGAISAVTCTICRGLLSRWVAGWLLDPASVQHNTLCAATQATAAAYASLLVESISLIGWLPAESSTKPHCPGRQCLSQWLHTRASLHALKVVEGDACAGCLAQWPLPKWRALVRSWPANVGQFRVLLRASGCLIKLCSLQAIARCLSKGVDRPDVTGTPLSKMLQN